MVSSLPVPGGAPEVATTTDIGARFAPGKPAAVDPPAALRYVSLADLAAARNRLVQLVAKNPDDADRARVEAMYDTVRATWEKRYAPIVEDYFGDAMNIAVVMTQWGDIHLWYRAGEVANMDVRIAEILGRVEYLESQARVLIPISRKKRIGLSSERRALVGAQLYSVAQSTLGFLDFIYWIDSQITGLRNGEPTGDVPLPGLEGATGAPDAGAALDADRDTQIAEFEKRKSELSNSAVEVATRNLDTAEASLIREARARGTRNYVSGMVLGILPIIGLAALLGTAIHHATVDNVSLSYAVGAGAIGAGISVLTRLVGGSLRVEPAASRGALFISGASRVVVGAIFGAVIFTFGQAGLVSLPKGSTGDGTTSATYLWISFGFLAGFSERWVQDLLGSVETPSVHKS